LMSMVKIFKYNRKIPLCSHKAGTINHIKKC
jgi:hypothetical protein